MYVICVPIVGRTDTYDCFESWRATGGNLKCVESAPRDSHHPDHATAPGLCRQPRNHLYAIILLLLCVFIEQQAIRIAATSDVDANARVTVAGQIGMSQCISFVSSVALTIWEILQDRRNRILFGIVGQPDTRRQSRTVFQGYQRVLDDTHSSWEAPDNHRYAPVGRDYVP